MMMNKLNWNYQKPINGLKLTNFKGKARTGCSSWRILQDGYMFILEQWYSSPNLTVSWLTFSQCSLVMYWTVFVIKETYICAAQERVNEQRKQVNWNPLSVSGFILFIGQLWIFITCQSYNITGVVTPFLAYLQLHLSWQTLDSRKRQKISIEMEIVGKVGTKWGR